MNQNTNTINNKERIEVKEIWLDNRNKENNECVCGENENQSCDCEHCSCGKNDMVLDQIQYLINTLLTEEQRVELFSNYCIECGKVLEEEKECDCYNYE